MSSRRAQRVTTLQIVNGEAEARRRAAPQVPERREVIDLNVRADDRELLSVNEACDRLGVGRTFLYQLMGTGQLEYVKAGRLRKIPTDAIGAYVRSLRRPESPNAI